MATRDTTSSLPDVLDGEHATNDTSETESGSSYAGTASSAPGTPICPYRNSTSPDVGCSRFLDCPTHRNERRATDGIDGATHRDSQELQSDAIQQEASTSTPEISGPRELRQLVHQVSLQESIDGMSALSRVPHAQHLGAENTTSNNRTLIPEPSTTDNPETSQITATNGTNHARPSAPTQNGVSSAASSRPSSSASAQSRLPRDAPSFVPTQNHPLASIGLPEGRSPSVTLPRWQSDSEVTHCPICRYEFGLFNRRHHCRKCGRVVCGRCSPHRITIPHQYIVRPPGVQPPPWVSDLYGEDSVLGGGERVRLCNPCVPDPNITPPQAPPSPSAPARRFPLPSSGAHQRSQSNANRSNYPGPAHGSGQYQTPLSTSSTLPDPFYTRNRSVTMDQNTSRGGRYMPAHVPGYPQSGSSGMASQYFADNPTSNSVRSGQPVPLSPGELSSSMVHRLAGLYNMNSTSTPEHTDTWTRDNRPRRQPGQTNPFFIPQQSGGSSSGTSGGSNRPLPPPPQISEEDECPVCHYELPSRTLPNFETRREDHIAACVTAHSTYAPQPAIPVQTGLHGTPPPRVLRRTGMFPYKATEKDCANGEECTICLEEYEPGVKMARLECLCRFHYECILSWFVNHPGRCPVHQHDSFGY